MMELKYITRGMSDPKGKPYVFFSCHPADFDTALSLISEDLLRYANCAVWYDPDPSAPALKQEIEEILAEMQLVVFAVSPRFLREENRARTLELPIALEHHIPVLPIMLENGLGYEFSNTCGKIQVVSKYVTDPTATPYEEVLETFLNSVLIGDELANKVRNAFDAYVFLSYRKKDRRHAQRLMRLIHENEEFRDIAVWYDEFLVPGEGFNEAIKDAFEKSSLFAMAVTPHLEEKGNYVMRVEYPMARDRREEGGGFEIVPVEMYEPEDSKEGKDWRIDPEKLKEHEEFKYREIPDLKDEHRPQELDRTFLDALGRIAKKEHDASAQHRFFIGLAYLEGIDMEINRERALGLIISAARDPQPCMDATAKLADMYRNGEGVSADLEEAIRWQKLLCSQYLDAYEKNHDPDEHKGYGTAYFKGLRKLSDLYREKGNLPEAVDSGKKALAFADELDSEVGIREQDRNKALICNRLGSLYRDMGNLGLAREYYAQAGRIYEKLAGEIGTKRARRDLSVTQERVGDLLRKTGDLSGASAYYEKAEDIREKLYLESPDAGSRRDLSCILTKLGNIRKSEKNYNEAGEYYNKALKLDKELAEEFRTPQAWDDYGVSLVKTGDIQKALGRYEEAAGCYEKAWGIFRGNSQKAASQNSMDHYAGSCEKLAGARKKLGDRPGAGQLYREAVELREGLYLSAGTEENAHALAAACYNYGIFKKDRELLERAGRIWSDLCAAGLQYEKYRDDALRLLKKC